MGCGTNCRPLIVFAPRAALDEVSERTEAFLALHEAEVSQRRLGASSSSRY